MILKVAMYLRNNQLASLVPSHYNPSFFRTLHGWEYSKNKAIQVGYVFRPILYA